MLNIVNCFTFTVDWARGKRRVPAPPRATGVRPEFYGHFLSQFFEMGQDFNFYFLRSEKVLLHLLGLYSLINPFLARSDVSH